MQEAELLSGHIIEKLIPEEGSHHVVFVKRHDDQNLRISRNISTHGGLNQHHSNVNAAHGIDSWNVSFFYFKKFNNVVASSRAEFHKNKPLVLAPCPLFFSVARYEKGVSGKTILYNMHGLGTCLISNPDNTSQIVMCSAGLQGGPVLNEG